jgi:chemotaxis response regulator CheB
MSEHRIILVNGSRLLHELLSRVLVKTVNLKLVQEVVDPEDLPDAIEDSEAEWVIMALPVDEAIPAWVDRYIVSHPHLRVMAVASDGSWVKTRWMERHEQELDDLSLRDVIHILGGIMEPA